MLTRTAPIRKQLEAALPSRPFRLELWDGSALPATTAANVTLRARSPQAVAHILRAPGQLGVGRAYVSGVLEVDDLDAALSLLEHWQPPAIPLGRRVRLFAAALPACGLMRPPSVPASELRLAGRPHRLGRDRRAVRHHYDLSPEFFALMLGDSMTYSCAIFSRGATTLEEAQRAKLELVCTKLRLEPGQRVLDVGCGWGSFALHAAGEHGVHVTGITLSEPQAAIARRRALEAGLDHLIDIRVMDYRELPPGTFDAIASIGMVEHVGAVQIDDYAARLAALLRPGGALLNHGIARLRHTDPKAGPFSERYVFPDAEPLHLSRIVLAAERAGMVCEHVEGFPQDYAETLRHWTARVEQRFDETVRLVGAERARVWRLYLRVSRRGFESGFMSVYQVLLRRPRRDVTPRQRSSERTAVAEPVAT